ncbi:uncharacterized protein LOC100892278 isoform X2 [Strongylocentrotus purpuratus]|uniref:DUF8077 domain-containing protein n=1 Tax=Strongylocentrotus purpuratus TaxID=7668 RepID=A0A7M7N428_STRPU|nr:uncharacterized protein LOC100892278 isoform X2 [Strongylocentrotus purpuratus]
MEGRGCSRERLLALVQLILLLGAFVNVAFCTLADEIASDSLVVRFDHIYDVDDWTQEHTDNFTSSVTTAVNTYCRNPTNSAACQISESSSNSTFTVVVSSDSPEYFNGDIKMTFYVRFPEADRADDAAMEYLVPKDTVAIIVEDNKEAIDAATGFNKTKDDGIVFIGEKRVTEIDNSMDKIMIPIVCVLFVVVVLMAVCLTCMQSRGEKKLQEQRKQQIGSSKGDEGITLTAVKSGSYASDDNNDPSADTTTTTTATKRFRRQKKLKDGRENPTTAPVQVQPEVQSSSNGSRSTIEVKPASQTADNFSSNNSNDLIQPRVSRHAIELPPLTTVSTPRTMSLDGSDSEDQDRKKDKKKKKHHRKLSQQSLVDAIDKDDDLDNEKSLSPLPEDNYRS